MKSRELSIEGWRKVVHVTDEETGLSTIISVHDDTLGPGLGGCRIFPYSNFEAGLHDVKRLSRGMTFKNALAGIPFGGGKAVIFADPRKDKTEEMIRAYGRAVESLGGHYYTAEDSGFTEDDIRLVRSVTNYAAGMVSAGKGGNPSPFTARGVWRGMQAAVRFKFGAATLDGLTVAILGVGAVGMELARLVHEEGGRLLIADINEAAVNEARERFGADVVPHDQASAAKADIFAPCALGGSVNPGTIDAIKAKIVAGAANNQLATPDMDEALYRRGILYAPDFVINAAGVISVGLEISGEWTRETLSARIDEIDDTVSDIFNRAAAEKRPTGVIAEELALEIIDRGRQAA